MKNITVMSTKPRNPPKTLYVEDSLWLDEGGVFISLNGSGAHFSEDAVREIRDAFDEFLDDQAKVRLQKAEIAQRDRRIRAQKLRNDAANLRSIADKYERAIERKQAEAAEKLKEAAELEGGSGGFPRGTVTITLPGG